MTLDHRWTGLFTTLSGFGVSFILTATLCCIWIIDIDHQWRSTCYLIIGIGAGLAIATWFYWLCYPCCHGFSHPDIEEGETGVVDPQYRPPVQLD